MDSAPALVQTVSGVLQKTSGCDKIARILQYGGLFIEWLIRKCNRRTFIHFFLFKLSRERNALWSDSCHQISVSAGSARKVFRLLGFIEQLRRAGNALSLIDPYRRGLVCSAKICSALFLFCDNMVWAQSVKLININTDRWKKFEYRFWLGQLSLSIFRDIYEWLKLARREYDRALGGNIGEVVPLEKKSLFGHSKELLTQNQDLAMDTLANLLDTLIPLTRLKFLNFPDGIVGLIGLITSVLRLIPLAYPAYKLPHS